MQHKVKVTVIDKKLYPELQEQYCADPKSGACPMYEVGDEFIFERYGDRDDFWKMGSGRQCSEAWDAISRYIYVGLQGGSIMHGWMNDDRVMICCCSDGTRPVIFKIERMDYKALYMEGTWCGQNREAIREALMKLNGVTEVVFRDLYAEVMLDREIADEELKTAAESCGEYKVTRIE